MPPNGKRASLSAYTHSHTAATHLKTIISDAYFLSFFNNDIFSSAVIANFSVSMHHSTRAAGLLCILPRLYFCAHHFCPKWKMFTFSRAHFHASTNATRRHEYFRGLSRLLPVPGVLVSFLELRFGGKISLLALGPHEALSKSKGTFLLSPRKYS